MRAFCVVALLGMLGVASAKTSKSDCRRMFNHAVEPLLELFDDAPEVSDDLREKYVDKFHTEQKSHTDQSAKKALAKKFAIEAIMRAEGRNWCDEDEKLKMGDAKHAVKVALILRDKDQDKMSDIVIGLVNSGMDVFEDGEDLFSEALECVKAYYQSAYEVQQGKAQKAKVRKVKREPVRKEKKKVKEARVTRAEKEQVNDRPAQPAQRAAPNPFDQFGNPIVRDHLGRIVPRLQIAPIAFPVKDREEFQCTFMNNNDWTVRFSPVAKGVMFAKLVDGEWGDESEPLQVHLAYSVSTAPGGGDAYDTSYMAFQGPDGYVIYRKMNSDRFFYGAEANWQEIGCAKMQAQSREELFFGKARTPTPMREEDWINIYPDNGRSKKAAHKYYSPPPKSLFLVDSLKLRKRKVEFM